jgi:hypothetical protein
MAFGRSILVEGRLTMLENFRTAYTLLGLQRKK